MKIQTPLTLAALALLIGAALAGCGESQAVPAGADVNDPMGKKMEQKTAESAKAFGEKMNAQKSPK